VLPANTSRLCRRQAVAAVGIWHGCQEPHGDSSSSCEGRSFAERVHMDTKSNAALQRHSSLGRPQPQMQRTHVHAAVSRTVRLWTWLLCEWCGAVHFAGDGQREEKFTFGIVDLVKVPDVPPGDYVLSWRWDVEQLPQVWSNCADVKIEVKGTAKATKPFTPWTGCEACCDNVQLAPCANCTKCLNDKTGDCSYCWNPLPGFQFGAIPQYQCLGHEAPDGGPGVWKTGMPFLGKKWSPGCPKCWAQKDSCKPSPRQVEDENHHGITLV